MGTVCKTGAYSNTTSEELRGTLAKMKAVHKFLRSNSTAMVDPFGDICENRYFGRTLTKGAARAKLTYLVDVAISRKSGVDPTKELTRDAWADLMRDCADLRFRASARTRVYSLRTRWARKRFAHTLDRRDD